MNKHLFIKYHPALSDLYEAIKYEIQQTHRPAKEVILDDNAVMSTLKISKRKLQYMKSERILPYHTFTGSPRTYYILSDILEILNQNRVESLDSNSIKRITGSDFA